jgi:hypothetical protein
MSTDKRNGVVVIALILSLTAGVGVLFLLEPGGPHAWKVRTALVVEQGAPEQVRDIEVYYASSVDEAARLAASAGDDSVCVVYQDRIPECQRGGPQVWLIVIDDAQEALPIQQQQWLLGALRRLTQASGVDQVRIRLAPPLDTAASADMSRGQRGLRELLERKQLIPS